MAFVQTCLDKFMPLMFSSKPITQADWPLIDLKEDTAGLRATFDVHAFGPHTREVKLDGDCLTVRFTRKQQNHFGGLKNDVEKEKDQLEMSKNQFGNLKEGIENPEKQPITSKTVLEKEDDQKIKKTNSLLREEGKVFGFEARSREYEKRFYLSSVVDPTTATVKEKEDQGYLTVEVVCPRNPEVPRASPAETSFKMKGGRTETVHSSSFKASFKF